ncbi:unnamed protein product [Rotaria sp. Silwood2]|nr:unnamed protein product [Rotaria sp. Silwood2]CAF2846117.1 unnamed protein product [Rotaria sp. Silwood2]CAF3116762.1 unnamed protein product [Rotaria sp. Silwood2]CAF3228264.1 unnamed protein product [Rotaria sp. Silwood2]CAF4171853.1 unnamed protein product [Rotaria sp. Silwood2]
MGGIRPAPPVATFNQLIINQLRHNNTDLEQRLDQITREMEQFRARNEQLETENNEMKRDFQIIKLKLQLYEQYHNNIKDTEQQRIIDRITCIAFRDARDAGATFINKHWIAERVHRMMRFVTVWRKRPCNSCFADYSNVGAKHKLSQKS